MQSQLEAALAGRQQAEAEVQQLRVQLAAFGDELQVGLAWPPTLHKYWV